MENNNIDNIFNLQVDQDTREQLKGAAYWARIVGIVNFVGIGISLLSALFGKTGGGSVALSFFLAAFMGLINFFLYLFLYRFGKHTTESLETSNQGAFNTGINGLRNFFKMGGILVIIGLSLFLILFLFGLAGAAFLGNR